jgi:glucokinase
MKVLAGDVGGTKTALTLYESDAAGEFRTLHERVYASAEHPSLLAVLNDFLPSAAVAVDAAVFSVAGPVQAGVCTTTNLPWVISEAELARELKIPVALINDFHAIALGVMQLQASDLRVLQVGTRDPNGVYAVIGAGTGLGEAVALPAGRGVRVLPGEGGHVDFAPRDETEWRLLQFLRSNAKSSHVSVERVVSGMGLGSLYDFVVADGQASDDAETRRRFAAESRGAVIGDRAEVDPAAARALALFVSAYGAEAGNLALKVLPTGGLYVAGGIAARMAERLAWDVFMDNFLSKGRMADLLRTIPVAVVLHPNVGLLGARGHAALLWRDRTLH